MCNTISKENKKILTTALFNSDVKGYKIVNQFTTEDETFYKLDISLYQKDNKPLYLVISICGFICYLHTKDSKGIITRRELRTFKELQKVIKGIKKDYIFNALSNIK